MIWSFSNHRTFSQCQRKWFYQFKAKPSNGKSKDPFRKEIIVLSNLMNIHAWRGNLVDYIISNKIIPSLNRKRLPNRQKTIDEAKLLFNKQLDFAKQKTYRQSGITKTGAGESYAAIFEIENDILTDSSIEEAWSEVEAALIGFFELEIIEEYLMKGVKLVPQRALFFALGEIMVRGFPDLIAFFHNQPPMIIDWKVHKEGMKSYRQQLCLYAMALTRCKPHKDFPRNLSNFTETDINLVEVQLLIKKTRHYKIGPDETSNLEDLIFSSHQRMQSIGANKDYKELSVSDYQSSLYAQNCTSCNFKKVCWDQLNREHNELLKNQHFFNRQPQ